MNLLDKARNTLGRWLGRMRDFNIAPEELTEKCQRCGHRYLYVWHAPNDLWKQLTSITDGSGLFCIDCFDAMADSKGIMLYWSCATDMYPGLKLNKLGKLDMP